MGRPEARIENYLVKQAEKNGCICWKFVSPAHSGVPDRVLIGFGRVIFIETKAENKSLRKLQETVTNQMKSKGAVVLTINARSQVDRLFEALNENIQITNENWEDLI